MFVIQFDKFFIFYILCKYILCNFEKIVSNMNDPGFESTIFSWWSEKKKRHLMSKVTAWRTGKTCLKGEHWNEWSSQRRAATARVVCSLTLETRSSVITWKRLLFWWNRRDGICQFHMNKPIIFTHTHAHTHTPSPCSSFAKEIK